MERSVVDSPSGRCKSEEVAPAPHDLKESLRLEQLRCSRLVAANQILRETQQYLMDKCTAITEEVNRLALESEASQSTARAREEALAVEHEHLRERLENARHWQARSQQLEEANRELHASLDAANQEKSVLVAQLTMLQQMLERLTNAHEQLMAMHQMESRTPRETEHSTAQESVPIARTPRDREPSFHVDPLREDLTSPPPPPPPADSESPPVSEGRASSEAVAAGAILPMQKALEELHQAEHFAPSGLSLLNTVIAEKRTADPYYDTFDAVERVSGAQSTSHGTASDASEGQALAPLHRPASVKDLIKNFDGDARRSPSAASLERLLQKDRSRSNNNVPDLLPQRHQPHMGGIQMGSIPPPPPNQQGSMIRSAHRTRPDGPAVALSGSPGRAGSPEDTSPVRGSAQC
jgi:hypothetical protein